MGDGVLKTFIVERSRNTKTGRVHLATYRSQETCPGSCPLMGSGCYAENRGVNGRQSPFGLADRGADGDDYTELIGRLERLPDDAVIRFNVTGDYLSDDGTPDMAYIEATNRARGDVLSYTHAWRALDPSWFEDRTRPNASCDSLADVSEARSAGWSTVIVDPGLALAELPGFVACLFDTKGLQCIDCRLCAKTRRGTVVFPVHGSRRRAAAEALAGA